MDAKKSEKYDVIQEMFKGWTWERKGSSINRETLLHCIKK